MIPVTKASQIIDALIAVLGEREPSIFALNRIEQDALALIKNGANPSEGHMLMGAVAALRFDADSFNDRFRIAKSLSADRHIRLNYSVMCNRLGLITSAFEEGRSLFERYPDDIAIVKAAQLTFMQSLNFDLMIEVEGHLRKLGVPEDKVHGIPSNRFAEVAQRVREKSVGHDAILERLEVASKILRDYREPIFGTLFDIGQYGRIGYAFAVKADIERMTELNFAIVDAVVEKFDDTLADIFTISCLVTRHELQPTRIFEPRPEAL